MPTLKNLIEELKDIQVNPSDVRIPAGLYDQIVDSAAEDDDDEE